MSETELLKTRLVGAWRLVSATHQEEGGGSVDQLGKGAEGFLLYSASGYMSAQLQAANRPHFKGNDPFEGSPVEFQTAASGYLAYAGPYTVDESHSLVVHTLSVSLFPNWIGLKQERLVRFEGERLVLTTAKPMPSRNGKKAYVVLTWQPIGQ